MTTRGAALRTMVLGGAMVVALAGCTVTQTAHSGEPIPSEFPSAVPGDPRSVDTALTSWVGDDEVGFTLTLPEPWVDVTVAYLEDHPEVDAAAVWSTSKDAEEGAPLAIATAGLFEGDKTQPRYLVDDAAYALQTDVPDLSLATYDGIPTAVGGAGWFMEMEGTVGGEAMTFFLANVGHGSFDLDVTITTARADRAAGADLVEGLKTLTFDSPSLLLTRAGIPENEDGYWFSYCRGLRMAVDETLIYDYDAAFDDRARNCPEEHDYLGTFVLEAAGEVFVVSVEGMPFSDMAGAMADYGLSAEAGGVASSGWGSECTTLWTEPFVGSAGQAGVVAGVFETYTDGVTAYSVTYIVQLPDVVAVVVVWSLTTDGEFRTPWLDETVDGLANPW